MSEFYEDLAETASELIEEFGTDLVLTHVVSGAYDPATGDVTNTETTHTGFGAAFDYESRDVDGTKIKVGDQRILIAVAGMAEPEADDRVAINGKTFTVVLSRTLAPAGVPVVFDVQARGLAA